MGTPAVRFGRRAERAEPRPRAARATPGCAMSDEVATTLDVLGASTELIRSIDSALVASPAGAVAGRVLAVTRGRFSMLSAQGPLNVATTGVSRVCVGDWVIVSASSGSPAPDDTYELLEVLPRTTA